MRAHARDRPLFRFQGTPSWRPSIACRHLGAGIVVRSVRVNLENCIASTSIFVDFQATKSQRWMPWRLLPMKDVGGCEKPRGAADQASIRGCPNGETRHPSWGVTPV